MAWKIIRLALFVDVLEAYSDYYMDWYQTWIAMSPKNIMMVILGNISCFNLVENGPTQNLLSIFDCSAVLFSGFWLIIDVSGDPNRLGFGIPQHHLLFVCHAVLDYFEELDFLLWGLFSSFYVSEILKCIWTFQLQFTGHMKINTFVGFADWKNMREGD